MSDVFDPANIPVITREESHIEEIAESVESIKSLMGQVEGSNTYSRKPSTEARERRPDTTVGTEKERSNFLQNLGDKFKEITDSFKQAGQNLGKNVGQLAFSTLLGPLQLITKPFEEAAGISFFDLLGKLVPKPFKGRPTKAKVLPKDPGAVLVANTIKGVQEEQEEGFLSGLLDMFTGKGALGGIFSKLLPILAKLGPIAIFAATMATDILGKGGAIEFWKKGEFGRAIFTGLFGKDLSEKSTVGKLLGIGKQALKWGSLGFLIGGPLGGLIGLGIGAAGAAIKLGVDTGFWKKLWKGTKKWTKIIFEWTRDNLFMPILNAFKNIWGKAEDIPIIGLIFKYYRRVFEFFEDWFHTLVQFFSTVFTDPGRAFRELGQNAWNNIKNLVMGIFEDIGPGLIEDFVQLGDIAKSIGDAIADTAKRIVGRVIEAWEGFKEDPIGFIQGIFDTIKATFENIKRKVFGFFSTIGDFFAFVKEQGVTGMIRLAAQKDFGAQFERFQKAQNITRAFEADPTLRTEIERNREFRDFLNEMRGRTGANLGEEFEPILNRLVNEIANKTKPTNVVQQNLNDDYSPDRNNIGRR